MTQKITTMSKYTTIDEYIAGFPKEEQKMLEELRKLAHKIAPDVEEGISYGIPVLKRAGGRIYISGAKKHVSIYPAPRGTEEFKKELLEYKGGKGTMQIPLNQPLPLELLSRIFKFRLFEKK